MPPRRDPNTPSDAATLTDPLVIIFRFASLISFSLLFARLGSTRFGLGVNGSPLHSVDVDAVFTPPRCGGS